jgi:hypothetical protein
MVYHIVNNKELAKILVAFYPDHARHKNENNRFCLCA